MLASAVQAHALVIVTAVDAVQVDFGTPTQRPLAQIDVAQAEQHLAEGQFPEGSMGPKIRAACRFVRDGGEVAVITSAAHAAEALRPHDPHDASVGTRVIAGGTTESVPAAATRSAS
jgi:carbamate kinase